MSLSSIVSIVASFVLIFYVNYSEGDPISALLNSHAAVVVLGGTVVALLGQFHLKGMFRCMRGFAWVVKPPLSDMGQFVEDACGWCRTARREGLLKLEGELDDIDDAFLRDGLQLIIDGMEAESVRSVLKARMEMEEVEDQEPAEMCEAIGGYAPTLGVLGAVIGLIHVMLHLDGEGESIGSGIAAAFVATLYGVGMANLIFLPMGKRLEKIVDDRARERETKLAALIMLAEGKNPNTMRSQLNTYLGQSSKAEGDNEASDAA